MAKDYFPEGFSCRGIEPGGIVHDCGMDKFDPAMRIILNLGREQFGRPLIINSACRCENHNLAIKGAKHSAHLPGPDGLCHAADIRVYSDITRAILHDIFFELGIRRFEVSDQHIHIDRADFYLPSPILASVNFNGKAES